jgi:PIN domain nuclease of toxin-antitoxin system
VLLVLDTHVWVWSVEGDVRRIGRRARHLLSQAEAQDAIRVSPATIFEVTALHTAGRLRLARPPEQWIRDALDVGGIRLAPLSPAIAIDAGHIPRRALADPLDRLLVATARQLDATFLTRDTPILDYASKTGHVRVHDAGV